METISKIIAHVLTIAYQSFWFAVILSMLFMFVWKNYASVKQAIIEWISWFKSDSQFRRVFLLVFYTVMILFNTLLNRNIWADPVSDVIGIWGFYNENGEFLPETIENLVLFIPFVILLFWGFREKLLPKLTLLSVLWKATKITFLSSFTIEMLQLFLRLGTWQLSDLFYNTLGGAIGGLIYYIVYKIKRKIRGEHGFNRFKI